MLSLAHASAVQQSSTQHPGSSTSSHLTGEASFSGAIVHRDSARATTAFSGTGRTLAAPQRKSPKETADKVSVEYEQCVAYFFLHFVELQEKLVRKTHQVLQGP